MKVPESAETLRRLAASGDEDAKKWVDSQNRKEAPAARSRQVNEKPVRDDLGYYKPLTKHTTPRIGDVYRLNDAKMNTSQTNSMVLVKEKKGEFVTVWTVTYELGRHKVAKLLEFLIAGFTSANVYVLTDTNRVMKKDMLTESCGAPSRET